MAKDKLINRKWPWIAALSLVLVAAAVAGVLLFTNPWKAPEPEDKVDDSPFAGLTMGATSEDLYCLEFTSYSGAFYEDGSNEEVENIAAILVENRSEEFLERATITYDVSGETATFVLTGLPAGKKCWVLEQNKMKLDTSDKEFKFLDCVSGFRKDADLNNEVLDIVTKDDTIKVTNTGEEPIYSVCVYYKNTHEDGNYLGGITYLIAIDEVAPGDTQKKRAGHFNESSEVVRSSYLTE